MNSSRGHIWHQKTEYERPIIIHGTGFNNSYTHIYIHTSIKNGSQYVLFKLNYVFPHERHKHLFWIITSHKRQQINTAIKKLFLNRVKFVSTINSVITKSKILTTMITLKPRLKGGTIYTTLWNETLNQYTIAKFLCYMHTPLLLTHHNGPWRNVCDVCNVCFSEYFVLHNSNIS
jgi:ribosomal protein L23